MSDITSSYPTTEPAELEPPETGWPKTIGIISIIYAICGFGCQILGIGSIFLTEWGMSLGGMDVSMPMTVKITTGVSAVVMTALGFFMLVGAVGVLRRRRSGVSRLRIWAVLRVLMIVVGLAIAILTAPAQIDFQRNIQEETNRMMRESGNTAMIKEFDEDATWTQLIVMSGVLSGLFTIYPIFIGFYLSRQKIKDEVATWE